MSGDQREGATVWLVLAAEGSTVEPGLYGAYISKELAEQHRALLNDPNDFDIEWTVIRSVLDPILTEPPA